MTTDDPGRDGTPARRSGGSPFLRGSRSSNGSDGPSGPVGQGLIGTVTDWIYRLAMLNLIWWLQVLAGGVVLGLAPATSVLYHQVRSNLTGDVAGDDFRSSWARWRRDFWRAQARYLIPLLTVVVLGFYLWMLRGQALASTVAILAAAYLCWLMHLPAVGERTDEVAPDRVLGATQLWLLTLRSFAVAPLPFLVAGVTTAFALGLGVLYVPVALIFAVPAVPALAASLAARFVPDALLEPPP